MELYHLSVKFIRVDGKQKTFFVLRTCRVVLRLETTETANTGNNRNKPKNTRNDRNSKYLLERLEYLQKDCRTCRKNTGLVNKQSQDLVMIAGCTYERFTTRFIEKIRGYL